MEITKQTSTWTAKDAFNVVKGKSLADCARKEMNVAAIAIGKDRSNDTGENVLTGYIRDDKGNIYTTVSKTARQQLDALIDMMDGGEEMFTVKVCKQVCKNDKKREFVYFDML